ncbi:hypothetical protein A5757_00255 [Mycobacterium sp. 852013-51886_SCH5428379]|uniref:DUF4190 domain-containing protein n=1 Tax=Mycobacterium sp. 852013-51886_SCH5428379 TaxID=1834111 RepID=UPI0008023190|nr:DUF4190 domain-containing protein [Mycobacterium sp. 852013-51886_SCH5428379]OBB61213.1 hypothetical protein A5757_00255 [Mycobacterium sp. 852013-51886_SCH5428379]
MTNSDPTPASPSGSGSSAEPSDPPAYLPPPAYDYPPPPPAYPPPPYPSQSYPSPPGYLPPPVYPGYSYPGGYPGGYPGAYPGGYAQAPTNQLAIWSLVASALGFICCIGSAVGVGLGFMALNQINERQEGGRGLAIAGIAVGGVSLLLAVAFWVLVLSA